MADGTRTKKHDEAIVLLQEQTARHSDTLADVSAAIRNLTSAVATLTGRFDQQHLNPPPPPPPRSSPDSLSLRAIKLDFPRFNGLEPPEDWLFKANEFFSFHQTPDEQRLTINSFHMDGAALGWFQWMRKNHQLTSWAAFSSSIVTRFGQTCYTSPQGALSKLSQSSTVAAYQSEFEVLANQTIGLPDSFFTDCFVEGLRADIRREVKSLGPVSFSHAVKLARLQEDKFSDSRRFSPRPFVPRPPPAPALLPSPTAPAVQLGNNPK